MPSNQTHPMTWNLRLANPKVGKIKASEYMLPTPRGEFNMVISAFAVKAILRCGFRRDDVHPGRASEFARVIRRLLKERGTLSSIRQVNSDADITCRSWLKVFDQACHDFDAGLGEELKKVDEELANLDEIGRASCRERV